MDKTREPGIQIDQIFLESASFSHRADYLALPPQTRVDAGEVEVTAEVSLSPDRTAGLLRLKVATTGDCLYEASLTMVGLFRQRQDSPNMPMPDFIYGPALAAVFPFLREAFASLTGRGRFGHVWLAPINAGEMGRRMEAKARSHEASMQPEETKPETVD